MSTKMKAFIGITVSFAFLIFLFATKGGCASRCADKNVCAVEEKSVQNEAIASVEAPTAEQVQ